jgi:hypothetical protein
MCRQRSATIMTPPFALPCSVLALHMAFLVLPGLLSTAKSAYDSSCTDLALIAGASSASRGAPTRSCSLRRPNQGWARRQLVYSRANCRNMGWHSPRMICVFQAQASSIHATLEERRCKCHCGVKGDAAACLFGFTFNRVRWA